jgi:hypothetical protein
MKDYVEKNRSLQFDFTQYSPGTIIYNINDLYKCITNDCYDLSNRDWIIEMFWGNYNGNASMQILSIV